MIEDCFDHLVQINWDHQDNLWWNETCAMVVEVFGLPGRRYLYHPHIDFMVFSFKNKMDSDLCKIMLSERL